MNDPLVAKLAPLATAISAVKATIALSANVLDGTRQMVGMD